MSLLRILSIVAAVLGAAGTVWLARGSFAYEQLAVWADDEIIRALAARNARRQRQQQFGLGLLMASFVVQGVSAILP